MNFSLLQLSLDQTISLEDMERAGSVLETLARPDIAKLHRELFGIVASGLQFAEANAFKLELEKHHYQTEVVPDETVPLLPYATTIQRIVLREQELEFTNGMGRMQTRPLADLLFLAGGFLNDVEEKVEKHLRRDTKTTAKGSFATRSIQRETKSVVVPKFRLDFFFNTEPYRIQILVIPENVAFYQGLPLRLRHPAHILTAVAELRSLLPEDRLTTGMFSEGATATYPNTGSYDEEIRWRFYQSRKSL